MNSGHNELFKLSLPKFTSMVCALFGSFCILAVLAKAESLERLFYQKTFLLCHVAILAFTGENLSNENLKLLLDKSKANYTFVNF